MTAWTKAFRYQNPSPVIEADPVRERRARTKSCARCATAPMPSRTLGQVNPQGASGLQSTRDTSAPSSLSIVPKPSGRPSGTGTTFRVFADAVADLFLDPLFSRPNDLQVSLWIPRCPLFGREVIEQIVEKR